MSQENAPEPLWSPEDLASFLKLPEKTLTKWRSDGTGPRWLKIGKHVRYNPKEVRDWMELRAARQSPPNRG
ncbi:AlpA family transcriptional regulator [Kutzneria sp. 744]|uniref:helix-turn-helix transcriptional regulator n=1 Tax=Kutzneria sp. (strain 744) TaxID=345341 RepID=UPI001E4C3229|nr:helix-turn-helix domain-containing protein [Kutzneria sp. 744]